MPLQIKEQASLQPFNSMAVSAKAMFLVTVSSQEELTQALDYAQSRQLSCLVLGDGSNTIFENDYDGLVILNRLIGIDIISQDSNSVIVKVAAGENWHEFVRHSIEQGWFGFENLALIPGLVGAAPMQNIGAYGVEVKDAIVSVGFIDIASREIKSLTNAQCAFAYRESIFKNKLAGKVIITSVTFQLTKKAKVNISYPTLANLFELEPTPGQVFDAVSKIRSAKLPLPKEVPNTGSFFKNPVVDQRQHDALKTQYPDLVSYPVEQNFKLAAGWMIEKAGWKHKSLNGVSVFKLQALVIVNPEKKTGKDVLSFAKAIQQDIEIKFGVLLEIEPRIY